MIANPPPAGGGDGGTVTASEVVTACNTYCDKETQQSCGTYTSATACKSTECVATQWAAKSAACRTSGKKNYDCLNASTDVCNSCMNELMQMGTDCK